jgi:hypothetical protein
MLMFHMERVTGNAGSLGLFEDGLEDLGCVLLATPFEIDEVAGEYR